MTTLDSQSDKASRRSDKRSSTELAEIPSYHGLPAGISPLESRVAGHPLHDERQTIGMLRRSDGRVFKPVVKPLLGKREITFYKDLQASRDPVMSQLRNYVPRYYGTTEFQIFGRRITFLMLRDITEGMKEPCVMDIKIGRRTWDPLATPEKRATEELKYAESKRTYGFCITGFQVYAADSGQLRKFGKHYGKTLDAKGVVEALRIFLNISPERPPCRRLIVKLLSLLWKILLFFRTQRLFRFYSSSLLVAYDAKGLRDRPRSADRSCSSMNDPRTGSSAVERSNERTRFVKRSISLHGERDSPGKGRSKRGSRRPDLGDERSRRRRSHDDDREDDVPRWKEDHEDLVDELTKTSADKQNWIRINMIDFTHVFPAEDPSGLDLNYLEGIENLIKLVEMFLVSEGSAP